MTINLGLLFLAAWIFVVVGVFGAWLIGKIWPPYECTFCGGEGCPHCCETGEINPRELDQADAVEVDGGRPVHELDYATRMDGGR
ncbi:hypothetical protein [Nocardia cyriacigeorgica]|uniref:hypothetical protein n=1 Tax=Nocardia cyriacigeorgica TaxID=135487 RepID=UPI001894CD6F|nr:hypothetical protein [Nocardia cyriacigeorgica]MBF6289274.1 hypothetical protein [Nocardia cyriacigeorgica]